VSFFRSARRHPIGNILESENYSLRARLSIGAAIEGARA